MIREFIYKYYIDPIRYGQPYSIIDTITYALVLVVSLYLVYRWLKRADVRIDQAFTLATLPYVVLGGLLRVVQDTGVIQSDLQFLLVTPLIFFVIFFFTVVSLFTARLLRRGRDRREFLLLYAGIGAGASLVTGLILLYVGIAETQLDLILFGIILALALATSAAVFAALKYVFHWDYVTNPLYQLLIFGHMLDASATSFGIEFHPLQYMEQHVVGSTLIDLTGTAFVMFPLKLVVVIPAIYILESYRRERGNLELWHLIILAMIVVGLAPGIRDTIRMVLYV
jgi:uncharacterized membrane protein